MDRWIITDLDGNDIFDARCEVVDNFISKISLNGTYIVRRHKSYSQAECYLVNFKEHNVQERLEITGVMNLPGSAIVPVVGEFMGEVFIPYESFLLDFAKQYGRRFKLISKYGETTECEFHHEESGSKFEIISDLVHP